MTGLKDALMKVSPNHSENFRKFAKSKFRSNMRVYRVGFDCMNGKCNIDDGVLYFGCLDGGFFTGVKVRSVRCKMFTLYCYSGFDGESISEVGCKDVTDWFVREYLRVGMCIDGDMHHKLKGDDKLSQCIYCDKSFTKKQRVVTTDCWSQI